MADPHLQILKLAKSFPCLRRVLGDTWDPLWLDEWACSPAPSSCALRAAQFVLSVWDPYADWKCGAFDFHAAVRCFDPDHLRALSAWLAAPWYP